MSRYIEPAQTTFDNAEQAARDMLASTCPQLSTKAGTVIRELLIRPFAYLYAWAVDNLYNIREKASVLYLKTSQATDNEIADAVASNYFITRQGGVRSRGVITMTVNDNFFSLPRGATFTVGEYQLETPYRVVARAGTTETGLKDGVMRVNLARTGDDTWTAQVPVQAMEDGPIEIAAGMEVERTFSMITLQSAVLTSAVTGGYGTETDAQLMARAEAATAASGVGSYFGIKRKLEDSPTKVLSMSLAGGEDSAIIRARRNSVNINPGGYVDCYVKTQNQLSTAVVPLDYVESDDQEWSCMATLPVSDPALGNCHGAVCVRGPLTVEAGGTIKNYKVVYGSVSAAQDGEGARLGTEQSATVYFNYAGSDTVLATLLYMPGLYDIQAYLNSDANRFVGQRIAVKAAIPVTLSVDCVLEYGAALTEDQLEAVKQAMADYVNGTKVGIGVLNFSDMRKYCADLFPGVDLRLPCTISASMPLIDGNMYSFYSVSGIVDLRTPAVPTHWGPAVCFFSLNKDNIRIAVA